MGDRSAINIIKDTLGKPSRAYDDAHNVKNYKSHNSMHQPLPCCEAHLVFQEALQRLSHYLVSRSVPPLLLLPHAWSKVPYVAQPSTMVGLAL